MSKVNNEMFNRKAHPFPKSIMQKFNNKCEHYDTIIIVEGISDEDFYKNTNIEILNNLNKVCYIYAQKNGYDEKKENLGKNAVIESYFDIKQNSLHKEYNNSVIFIVDKDFFGINWNAPKYRKILENKKAKNVKVDDINNFTILDCHSHECYFILENNLKQIFKLLNIEDKLEQFNNIFNTNLEGLSEYFAYKSILEDENPNRSYLGCQYDNINNIPGINFNFEYKDGELKFNKVDMQKGIETMKKEIEYSHNRKNFENQYLEMKQKFKQQPELLRGHTLFELLECYLRYYGKYLTSYNEFDYKYEYKKDLIKSMSIPLIIKKLKIKFGEYIICKKHI